MRLAVLGDPVADSRSPLLHRTALRLLGIPGDYRALGVDAAGMRRMVDAIRSGDLDGANVTMPHKRLAAGLADVRSTDVERTAAANTLVRLGDGVAAHNTDIPGIRHAWRWAGLPDDAPVLILGAGGAAAAAAAALEGRALHISARHPDAAAPLIDRLAVDAVPHPWGVPLPDAVVVNATPIGMGRQVDMGKSLPPGLLDVAVGLLDMAYGAGDTPAVVEATRIGIPVADGAEMLLGQAIESFRLWTGREAPLDDLRLALATATAGRP